MTTSPDYITDLSVCQEIFSGDWIHLAGMSFASICGKIAAGEALILRLLQERGFDIEDMRLRGLARLERLSALVWAAAQFLWRLGLTLPDEAQEWLRRLGGKMHRQRGTNGLYLLLYGLSTLLTAYAVGQLRISYRKALPRGSPP